MSLSAELSHIWYKVSGQRAKAQREAKQAFARALADLKPDDVVIDLGANAGEFTVQMAKTGAKVYAFEPDPHALGLLNSAVAGLANVSVMAAAAGVAADTAMLYRKRGFEREADRATKSSSLVSSKRNVDPEHSVTVEVVDFPSFLEQLNRDIAVIKMDIEGAEVDLLEHLLDHRVASRIGEIYVETHERALPETASRIAALKIRSTGLDRPRINWDWH